MGRFSSRNLKPAWKSNHLCSDKLYSFVFLFFLNTAQLKFHEDGAERVLSGYWTRVSLAGLLSAIIKRQIVQLPGGEELIDVSSVAEIIRAASAQRNVSFALFNFRLFRINSRQSGLKIKINNQGMMTEV